MPTLPAIPRLSEWRRVAAALLLTFGLSGCDSGGLAPLSSDASILAFGDSLTAGNGVDRIHSYPSVLASLTGRRVINAGLSGEVTAEGLQRLQSALDAARPELLILLEGGNDILRNTPPEQTQANLARMIEMAQARQIQVVLVAVPQKSLFSSSAPFYRELAEEYGVVLEDELIASLLRDSRYKSDSVHFNQAGYQRMAQELHTLLMEQGAL